MGTDRASFRIGIDVGGTFTKAVLLDHVSLAVVARHAVHTTHDNPRGVAAGVVEVFRALLARSGIPPDSVVFIAHSTTQATNALLEGDVAKVGIIGLAGSAAAALARPQAAIAPIDLAPGAVLATANRFLVTDALTDGDIRAAIDGVVSEGAQVLVASAAFGVDNTGSEELVRRIGTTLGLPTTCGHEITKLYGLAVRTRTAVVNASILPKMITTATMTEASIRDAGITAPLMIMRGDGGAMLIDEMHRRPAMTMLSGPAASVAGSLMHLKMSDGIYFEVGGTSTNIAVIQSGRPSVTYAQVGGHDTYVSSLDVRVLGVAGGSLVRVRDGAIVDVGPRSAHIAGLPYAAFADPHEIVSPKLETFEPKPGDGPDYVAVRVASGARFALTTTCAANVLGTIPDGAHSRGNREAARAAFVPLARGLNVDVDTAARQVLDKATDKLVSVVEALMAQYRLDPDQRTLIAVGGGAGTLGPILAQRLGIRCEIAPDAEVISSIGAASAMVREVVERVLPQLQPEDLEALREEALAAAVRAGADGDTVDVSMEIDQTTGRVRAIGVGAAAMQTARTGDSIVEPVARDIAARSFGMPASHLHLAAATAGARVYLSGRDQPSGVRIVDRTGVVRLQRSRALVVRCTAKDAPAHLDQLFDTAAALPDATEEAPGLVVLLDSRVVDLIHVGDRRIAATLAAAEWRSAKEDTVVALVLLPR